MKTRAHSKAIVNAVHGNAAIVASILQLEETIGYYFRNPYFLIDAVSVNPLVGDMSIYRRYAHLGDRIINLASYCYLNGSGKSLYNISGLFTSNPSNIFLRKLSDAIGLTALVRKINHPRSAYNDTHLLADICEGMFAAIARDSSTRVARSLFISLMYRFNMSEFYRKLFNYNWEDIANDLIPKISPDIELNDSDDVQAIEALEESIGYEFTKRENIAYYFIDENELAAKLSKLGRFVIEEAIATYLFINESIFRPVLEIDALFKDVISQQKAIEVANLIDLDSFLTRLDVPRGKTPDWYSKQLYLLIAIIALDSKPSVAKKVVLNIFGAVLNTKDKLDNDESVVSQFEVQAVEVQDNMKININNFSIFSSLQAKNSLNIDFENSLIAEIDKHGMFNPPAESNANVDQTSLRNIFKEIATMTKEQFAHFFATNKHFLGVSCKAHKGDTILMHLIRELMNNKKRSKWIETVNKIKMAIDFGSSLHEQNNDKVTAAELIIYYTVYRDELIEYYNAKVDDDMKIKSNFLASAR